ncbi:MAG: phosphotransferase [Bacilli bacterium]|nr:phosphotransferase [Bacilli bacterium]
MKHEIIDGRIIFHPKGAITSTTAPEVERDIEKTLQGQKIEAIDLDLEDVNYVSSAGLRVILKYKKLYPDTRAINVTPEVYDVLEMTGFTTMMDVRRQLLEVSVEGAKLIGEGFFSLVYRLDHDTIIKVFRNEVRIEEVERELKLAKQAFVLGIPTAISYDVVHVGDRLGVRFEMLDCASLRDCFRDHPEDHETLVRKYAELLTTINTTTTLDPNLPDARVLWLTKADACAPFLSKEEAKKLKGLIESVEDRDTFVHGDCHFKNIMVQNGELLLIDMDTLSKGHPIFELAAIYATYIAFEEATPGNNLNFLGIDSPQVTTIFHDVLAHYFGKFDETIYAKIALVSYTHMIWWNQVNDPTNQNRHDVCLQNLRKRLAQVSDLDIGK